MTNFMERAFAANFRRMIRHYAGFCRVAGLRINPLQDAVDLGKATEEEQRSLQEWKKYRVALSRLSALEAWPNVDRPSQPAPI
ncbi:tail fiber assembly protein [Pseudomonas sp. SCB32]|uniref:tail fiber assembly protein n=1 Tax=Pseudomonas sp. SCB32 TaxID=2653853 RepID=UPI0012642E8B|nr:tail fiber assembly protein [Pseudomonas sp. SCB32]